MTIRLKLLLVLLLFGIAPVLVLSLLYDRSSERTVERMLRAEVRERAAQEAREIETRLAARESDLIELAHTQAKSNVSADISEELRTKISNFIKAHHDDYASIACVSRDGRPLFRIEPPLPGSNEVRLQTTDFLLNHFELDKRVWTLTDERVLRAPVKRETYGAGLRETIPVFPASGEMQPVAALISEVKFGALCQQIEDVQEGATQENARASSARPTRFLIVLDRAGQIIYHTNDALMYQTVAGVMPYFVKVSQEMSNGKSDVQFYDNTSDNARWLAAYQPLDDLNLSLAVAANYTEAVAAPRLVGLIGVALALLAAIVAAILLTIIVRRASERIDRVAQAAAAIAGGQLDQRILVRSSDETHALAESFNMMSEQLREHIARESETKQFESFIRISAMLTHDLKNAITGLSMLVNNMERQFHREEFRADAIAGLRDAADKLRVIVSRLSEPVKTLSGEYRRNVKPVDLVSMIKRVMENVARPSAAFYEIETQLPDTLVVPVDADRIECVVENLIINAIEAMGARGGRLTVSAGMEDGNYIFFSVADTGIGMSEEFIRTRLFRAFATTKNKGIGLGLYTCREIVEAHGGRLNVESERGVGTCFRVVLPSTPITGATRRNSAEQSLSKGTMTKKSAAG